jgi:uncharacterized protein YpbB
MGYRLMGYTHRQIAKQMDVAPSTVYKWVSAGLPSITQQTAEESRRVMMEQCHQIIQKLMPLMDETAPKDILGGILKVRQQQMKLGLVAGQRRHLRQHRQPGEGDSDEDIVVRIKADAPVLRPNEPVPVRPLL